MPLKPAKAIRRRRWMLCILGFLALFFILAAADYTLYPQRPHFQGRSPNRGTNGIWLRYTWYFGEHSDAEVQALARRLEREQMPYAYFHVRSIQKDGTLRFHHPAEARKLVHLLKSTAPSIRPIAWIYVGNSRGVGEVDLSDPAVRRAMIREARWLVDDCGFEGVQWDYEVCDNGDESFLRLLEETRAALPGKILSVATPLWMFPPFGHWGWTEDYFAQIARRCDQLVVMGYDSGFRLPRAYDWLMRQEVIHVTRASARGNPACRVLFGVPAYPDSTPSHDPRAENIRLGIAGVREGLSDSGSHPEVFAGVVPFADYTMRPDDWQAYDELWRGEG